MSRLVTLDPVAPLPPELLGGAVSIGNFDGVHRGHSRIARQLVAAARQVGGPAIAFTFDPHPAELLRPESAPPKLTTLARRAALLGELGVDAVVACPTTTDILRLTPGEFFERILVGRLQARGAVEGPNFLFGRDRIGDVQTLAALCQVAGLTFDVVPPLEASGRIVSSSRVRELLETGDVDGANELLTRPYQIVGVVRPGARRGAGLGFPTANLHDLPTLVPGPGVYAGAAEVEGQLRAAALHVGPNPTFGEERRKVEVHLPDWRGDLYGATLAVDILSRLRDIHPFASVGALVEQLGRDVAEARLRFERARPTPLPRSTHGA